VTNADCVARACFRCRVPASPDGSYGEPASPPGYARPPASPRARARGQSADQLTSSGCYRSRRLAVSDGTGDRSDSDGRGVGRLVTVRYQRLRAPRLGGGPGGDHVVVCHRKPQSSPPPRREPPAPAGYFQRQLNGVRPAPALSTVQASLSSNAFAFFSSGASKPSDYERRPACSGHARVGQGPKQGC
jgi:hypothetical protein